MSKGGPIKVMMLKDDPKIDSGFPENAVSDTIELPSIAVIEAGMKKFREYSNLHWPAGRVIGTGELKLASFDHRNDDQLRIALAMTFISMLDAMKQAESPPGERSG